MIIQLKSYLCLLLMGFGVAMISGCTQKSSEPSLRLNNFYQVSDDVYRSGQPSKDQMAQLEQQGIKSIINLRAMHSDRDEVDGTNLTSYWVRINAGNITDEKMISVLKLIKKSPKPVLIHCWHGSDRTGVTIAMYRLVFQNWSKQAAIDELMQPEYGHHYNYYPNIVQYLDNVDIDYIKAQVL